MTAIAAGNGNAFDSISQACFLIKPRQTESPASTPLRKGKGKGKRKIAPAENAAQPPSKKSMLDLFQRLEEGQEKVEAVEMRMKLYQETWQRMRHRIDNVLRDINLQTLLEIDRFVQDVPDIEAEAKSEIPTGLVFAGINVADHASLFNQMTTMIQDNDPNLYFANLQSKDCANLKAIVKNTIEAFIFAEDKQHEDQEDEMEETAFIVPKGHTRLAPDDMHLLLGWYRHIRKDRNARPKLVIVLQDFERIEPLVIQDFINILSEYSDRIPFILLIGIATSFEAIHQALPTSVISLLAIEKFYVQPPTSSFNAIIKELFLNSPDLLHYGPKAFKIFNDNFFLHNFSIETLASALKYTCMHHFYGNALSIFNVGDPNEMYTIRDTLSPFHYTALRMLPSFKELCESASEQDPLRVKKLLTSDVHLYEELEGALHDMQQYQQDFAIGFEVLLLVIDRMPTRPSMPRKTPRQLHFMALEEDLHATSYLQDVCFACRNLQYSVFESTLNDIAAYLQSILSENELLRVVQDFQEQLGKIDGEAADAVANKNTDTQRLFGRSNLPSKAAKVDTTAADALTSLAESFSQWLAQLFESRLKCHTQLPFHELVYYNSVRLHKNAFHPQPRAAVQTALGQPHHYLNCTCCKPIGVPADGDEEATSYSQISSSPDTCILYKLYMECGRLINLYDWFTAFTMIVHSKKTKDEDEDEDTIDEKEIQARFVKSVAEMQFLGFIKPTKRKTDHVEKLVWSTM